MIRRAARLRSLATDRRGTTVIEFAIVAPVMMIAIMGLGDLLYQAYVQTLLTGAIQKAARDSAIQGGAQNAAAIDAKVVAMVASIVRNPAPSCATTSTVAAWCSNRQSYSSFAAMAPEPFTDSNGNGVRDKGECFTDVNGNGSWDADPGLAGQGGANDVALYSMRITYPRIFPVATLIGLPAMQTVTATALLKNQPYATQNVPTAKTICT